MAVAETRKRKRGGAAAAKTRSKPMRMGVVRVKSKAQVTIPVKVREQLGIDEGDYLEISVRDDEVVMKRKFMLDGLPEVKLSPEWQRMVEEALEDVRAGRVRRFNSVKEGLEALRHEFGLD